MRAIEIKATILAGVVLTAGLIGCTPASLRVRGGEAKLPADDGSPGFLDRVASQLTVSENDALRGMILLLDGEDKAQTFQQRVEDLAGRGIIDRSWRHEAGRALTKGRLAYMACQACKVRGGVLLSLTGPSQRYCLREMQFQGFLSPGTIFSRVSGMEYVAVLSRADVYKRTGELPQIMKTEEAR